MPFAPRQILAAAVATLVLIAVSAAWMALGAPQFGLRFTAGDSGGLVVADVAVDSPNQGRIEPGAHIIAFLDSSGRDVALDADLLIEEPDQLEVWPRYNSFMERQSRLADAAAGGALTARLNDGRQVVLQAYARNIADLPGMFWLQVAVGVIAYLIAAGVWAFRIRDRAAIFYALAGLGLLLSASAAAVYSSRELIMAGTLVRPLSLINHFGSLAFTGALFSLMWNYPRRLARFPAEIPAFGLMLAAWFSNLFGVTPDLASAFYVPILVLFAPTFLLAFLQWRHTRGMPVERAALKWFLLSIYLGTCLFAVAILIPLALGRPPVASQGMMFVVFLFMFVGIALGIVRYRLFDLDRWWFRAWLWLLGGLAVLLLDFFLVTWLQATQLAALSISLAVVGWAYFPARQWLLRRLLGGGPDRERQVLELSVGEMLAARSLPMLEHRWENVLRRLFAPLEFHHSESPCADIALDEHGLALRVPSLDNNRSLILRYPHGAARLFNRADEQLVRTALGLVRFITEALDARDKGMHQERQRIMRDLHDDLGAKLLSLIHTAGGGEREALARSAMRDMRDVLTALEAESCPLGEALAVLRAELEGRAAPLGFELEWNDTAIDEASIMSARARTNLGRIVREAVTNAVRHGGAGRLEVHLSLAGTMLHFTISDNGAGAENPAPGRGMRSMQNRARELGGDAAWSCGGAGCRIEGSMEIS